MSSEESSVKTPNAPPSSTDVPRPSNAVPRARWLAWICIILAIYTFLIASDIEAVSRSVPVIVLVMSIWLAVTAIPLLVYVAVNGLSALRFVLKPPFCSCVS